MSNLEIVFEILLSVLALVAIGLASTTVIKVFRLRNKRLSWRAGTLAGYPLFSTIFFLISLILVGVTCAYGSGWKIASAVIYLIISCSWFVASYFASKRYITDYGIVKNINEPHQTVAWHQIYDFFELSTEGSRKKYSNYIFLYHKKNETGLTEIVRLPLQLPSKKLDLFKNLIRHKLGQRLHCFEQGGIDISELENF